MAVQKSHWLTRRALDNGPNRRQSQRDSGLKAQGCRFGYPGLVTKENPKPKRGCAIDWIRIIDLGHNPVGVAKSLMAFSEGSSFLATLGFGAQSRWD